MVILVYCGIFSSLMKNTEQTEIYIASGNMLLSVSLCNRKYCFPKLLSHINKNTRIDVSHHNLLAVQTT